MSEQPATATRPATPLIEQTRRYIADHRGVVDLLSLLVPLLLLWQFGTRALGISAIVLPTPLAILESVYANQGVLFEATLKTSQYVLLGFATGSVFGLVVGAAIAYSETLEEFLNPVLVVTFITPKIVLAPLLVLWFTAGPLYYTLMPFLFTFFPMIENTAQGVRGIDQQMKDLTRLFQANRWVRFRHVTAPHILPYVMAGLKIGTLQAISGVIVAEFVAPEQGLGFMLILGQQFARTELTFAAIFLVAVIGVGFYKAVELTERRVVFWETKAGDGL